MGVARVRRSRVFAGREGDIECVCRLITFSTCHCAAWESVREDVGRLPVVGVNKSFSLGVTVWT